MGKGAKQFEFKMQRPDEANKEALICLNDFIFTSNKGGEGLFKEEAAPAAGEKEKQITREKVGGKDDELKEGKEEEKIIKVWKIEIILGAKKLLTFRK